VLKEAKQEDGGVLAPAPLRGLVLDEPKDMTVRPSEGVTELERGLPVASFRRSREGVAAHVVDKERIAQFEGAPVEDEQRLNLIDLRLVPDAEVGQRLANRLLGRYGVETRQQAPKIVHCSHVDQRAARVTTCRCSESKHVVR